MKTLIAGANVPLTTADAQLAFDYRLGSGELDLSVYLLDATTNKVRGDADMLFYGQKQTPNGAVVLDIQAGRATLRVNTAQLDKAIGKIAVCATIDGAANLAAVQQLNFQLTNGGQAIANAQENGQGRSEAAIILAELYLRNGEWKCRWVMQGFNGGLQPLAEHFGVEVADEPAAPPPAPKPETKPASNINLSKVTLDKRNSSINLEKKSDGFGQIKVNLNWNQGASAKKGGFLSGLTGSGNIDLDLGAMIRMKNGDIYLVQALGESFGSRYLAPYTELQGDDRTGESRDGEWIFINGQHWQEIDTIVVYCFIYSGAPNWAATDGVVKVFVPGQAEIEVALTEGDDRLGLCGIVELRNQRDNIQVNRVVRYFTSQSELDQHFGFGFRWKKGRK